MEIMFMPMQTKCVASGGQTLLAIASEHGVAIDGNCAGAGTCGKCKVRVIGKTASKPDKTETERLTPLELEQGYRLACRYVPTEDITVEVPFDGEAQRRKTQIMHEDMKPDADQHIAKSVAEVQKACLENQKSDDVRIKAAFGADQSAIHASIYEKIPGVLKNSSLVTITKRDEEIIHIEAGDTTDKCCGVAFDIGTTTVVGMLWDMKDGKLLAAEARTNPQGTYGADVISRITYAKESEENLQNIHEKIIDCCNDIIDSIAGKAGIKKENIYEITAAGNTTMAHLYMKVNPGQLAFAPFAPVFCSGIYEDAYSRGIVVNPCAKAYLLPCIAGHVGADITAGLIASNLLERKGLHLMMDIGTNGEIVLVKEGNALTCSTAAGPAFEGASIFQGMRAAEGAVESVKISKTDVSIKTIGNKEPVGLCGSGIIDAAAALIESKIIDKTGRMADQDKLLAKGFSPQVASRAQETAQGKVFVLAYREGQDDIVITQKDIREIQLAKAAIRAGVTLMLQRLDVSEQDIDMISLAGTFGNHIKVESAVTIGLIPDIDREKIEYIGNAAGIGASLALISKDKRAQAHAVANNVKHLELSTCEDFQDTYLKEMMF